VATKNARTLWFGFFLHLKASRYFPYTSHIKGLPK